MTDQTREFVAEKLEWVERRDHYALLGVTKQTGLDAIKDAYVGLARRLQPDRLRDPTLLAMGARVLKGLSEAQAVLTDPKRRAVYDRDRNGVVVSVPRLETNPRQEMELQRLLLTPTAQLADRRVEVAKMLHHKGAMLFSRDDFNGAERYLRRAVDLDPSISDYHLRLGWTLFTNQALPADRRINEAREHIDRAISIDPLNSAAHYSLACFWKEMGQPNEHRQSLEAAVRGKPRHAKAELELSVLKGRESRAVAAERQDAESRVAEKKRSGFARFFGGGS